MNSLMSEVSADLRTHLGEEGEEEFSQLISLIEDEPRAFMLVIVRSDFDTNTRDALIERLAVEITPVPLQTIPLSGDSYDLPVLLAQQRRENDGPTVIVVTGLEETPHIAFDEGKASRPIALAILNHGREAIRRIGCPLMIWCDPLAYAALREHAPDFFDHYTGLFTFLDASPAPLKTLTSAGAPLFDTSLMPGGRPRLLSAISPRPVSPAAVQFYVEQLERLQLSTPERAHALIGLADALFASPKEATSLNQVERIEVLVREALEIFEQAGTESEHARAHALLANLIKRKLRLQNVENPAAHPSVQYHIEEALKVFSETSHPVEWGALQWLLADYALEGDEEALLRRAIPHLQAAQRVFTQQTQPYFWASCEINLGNIYTKLPYTARNVKRALSHLEAALRVYTEHDYPHEWAMVQLLIGKAHFVSAQKTNDKNERSKLMRRAIVCYEAAQRGYARKNEWQSMALALSLAALTWRDLPTGNRRQHLRQCANCWLQAADYGGRAGNESLRAVHLNEAGDILLELASLTRSPAEVAEARQALEAASNAFAHAGDYRQSQQKREVVQRLDALLQEAFHLGTKN